MDNRVSNYRKTNSNGRVFSIVFAACLALSPFTAIRAAETPNSQDASAARAHVILVSLDTTRADHLGCYGSKRVKTPRLDALARESILFEDCLTAVPTTLASHVTMFTGKYPHTHGVPRNGFLVNDENVMLAEILKERGYRTAAFPASFALHGRFQIAQGFDYYDDGYQDVAAVGDPRNQRRAADVTRAVLEHVGKMTGEGPWFLFVHYYDPHMPYDPPGAYRTMYAAGHGHRDVRGSRDAWGRSQSAPSTARLPDAYAGEVSYMDEHAGRLLDGLRARGILDGALLLVTSDHGETLLDHTPHFDHGLTVYEDTMHVICMFRLPGAARGGTRVSGQVSNSDFLPTILGFVGLMPPKGVEGKAIDLLEETIRTAHDRVFGQATKPHAIVEAGQAWPNMRKARVVREGDLAFIQTPFKGEEELYDLCRDPRQHRNLVEEKQWSSRVTALREHLEAWAASARPLPSRFETSGRGETLERLEALGYLE